MMLNSASDFLYQALDGKAKFRSANVILPKSWSPSECGGKSLIYAQPEAYQVLIDEADVVHGPAPFTIQPRGCGEPGLLTVLTPEFLRGVDYGDKGRAFVHEWAKLRYGVFEEYGFADDPLYPAVHTEYAAGMEQAANLAATGCADAEIKGEFLPPGCVGPTCTDFRPTNEEDFNETATEASTSIMYLQYLSSVTRFCNSSNHNRVSPNRQNAFCGGRSVEVVILDHPDFMASSKTPRGIPEHELPSALPVIQRAESVTLNLVTESPPKTYFLLDNAVTPVKWYSARAVPYNLQRLLTAEGIEDGVCQATFFGEKLGLEIADWVGCVGEDDDLLPGDPDWSPIKSNGDLITSAIQKALQHIEADGDPENSHLIVVTDDYDLNEFNMLNIADAIQRTGVHFHVFYFDGNIGNLEIVARDNGGTAFRIRTSNHSVDMATEAIVHLEQLVSGFQTNRLLTRVSALEETVGTFQLDEFVGDFDFTIYGSRGRESHYPRHIKLRSPSGRVYTESVMDGSQMKNSGTYTFKFKDGKEIEVGLWDYSYEMISGEHHSAVEVKVYEKTEELQKLRYVGWTSWDTLETKSSEFLVQSDPLMLYVRLTLGHMPVVNATVFAIVTTSLSSDAYEVRLLDNGMGDPDVQRADGVYSAYFTDFTPGEKEVEYRISYVISSNNDAFIYVPTESSRSAPVDPTIAPSCCGSGPIEGAHQFALAGTFERTVIPVVPHLVLHEAPPGDVYPPNKIMDFKVEIDELKSELIFTWTAPGGNFTSGSAEYYKLSAANNSDYLYGDVYLEIFPTEAPLPYGSMEKVIIPLHSTELERGVLYYFGVKAFEGVWQNISNIVPASFAVLTEPKSRPQTHVPRLSTSGLVGIIMGSLGFALIVATLLLYCHFYWRKDTRRKLDTSGKPKVHISHIPPEIVTNHQQSIYGTKASSEDDLRSAEGGFAPVQHHTAQPAIVRSSMADPVGRNTPQFISASDLLTAHERRQIHMGHLGAHDNQTFRYSDTSTLSDEADRSSYMENANIQPPPRQFTDSYPPPKEGRATIHYTPPHSDEVYAKPTKWGTVDVNSGFDPVSGRFAAATPSSHGSHASHGSHGSLIPPDKRVRNVTQV
ncbi:unnamed protein product [Cyprideis torosa]|uniref:Uncharacterized protein n=1 Tax=Cyprideis torosa TaxID=163714 RepID=A0A7R8WD47_9CRUS|nr:unnamed protein product [Cyprideis torosa]CAG0894257.1 unnamed protein product [Cyprideis torosa]